MAASGSGSGTQPERTVFCVKFQREMPGLDEVPFDGHPLGQRIYENVSKEAWRMWVEQMKMILTRQGFNSKMVVTGDQTQIDLPGGKRSGLLNAVDVLKGVEGIAFVTFDDKDVVRHSLVQRIIKAYDRYNDLIGAGRQLALRLDNEPATENRAEPPLNTAVEIPEFTPLS